ncbi:MAG: pyridoxal 5'-phosphate synthase glutaminase subunit PdxT [Thermoplasmata archaeon]|jgi:5'-phosphate synthase pdxT subunit|nr:pyridoxal 5'-phosphate synthase glutaminase subunit PdxT [Thermoplasmatales archaeon]PMP75302.1 MAG: pyridoxal 5'-phosphate synthase glutaminase subunit PdxT [Aciduliprofundum sp.]
MLNIGVLNIQGDVSEHGEMLKKAFVASGISGNVIYVKDRKDLEDVVGIIIPGGESTTISRLLKSTGLFEEIRRRALDGSLGVMGTCAGTIIISKNTGDPRVTPMGIIDIDIKRNAYGRQYSSFQVMLDIKGLDSPFPAVFIRAPVIERVYSDVEIMAKYNDDIVFVRKGNIFALTFHPELTDDYRIHKMFIEGVGGISTGKE